MYQINLESENYRLRKYDYEFRYDSTQIFLDKQFYFAIDSLYDYLYNLEKMP